jgi:hypothetical protein
MKRSLRICNKCNWVHFGVTRKYAELEVKRFGRYFNKLSKDKQQDYYGGKSSSIADYDRCNLCKNSYKNFRIYDYKKDVDIYGCTLSPIIFKTH